MRNACFFAALTAATAALLTGCKPARDLRPPYHEPAAQAPAAAASGAKPGG